MKTLDKNINNSWEDQVFEYRNKLYGAYFIRKIYSKHVLISSLITIFICLLVVNLPEIINSLKPKEEVVHEAAVRTIKYTDLAPPPPIDKNVVPPKIEIPQSVKAVIKFLPPKVTEKEVLDEEDIPTQEEMKLTQTGSETIEGTGNIIYEEPVNTDVIIEEKDETENQVFTYVEQMPEFPGGTERMMEFLAKNIRYPSADQRMGTEGTVYVSFVISKNGSISDISIMKGISEGCNNEAIRVISKMPEWRPGKQNGKAVTVKFVVPIRFKLTT